MPRKKKRRNRTEHAGVKLKARTLAGGKVLYLARWRDPVTGKEREVSLAPLKLTNDEARRAWAIRRSRELAAERAQLAAGGTLVRNAPGTATAAVKDYIDRCRVRLRERTVSTYEKDLKHFADYCADAGIACLDQLIAPHVARYREQLAARRRMESTPRGHRGARRQSERARSPATINRSLASLKAFLMDARRLGLTPKLDRDSITDGIKKLRESRPRPAFLRSPEIRVLLAACLRHDATNYAMTRAEHDGEKPAGSSPRFAPIGPLALAALLTGARLGELLSLRWENVHLAAPDKGELIVTATASKTHQERSIALDVSPSLVRLLAALKLKSKGETYVFGGKEPMTEAAALAGRKRLIREFGAPRFSFQRLRQTCGSFLANAGGIYGGASTFHESKRLGHAVNVAERFYLGVLTDIPKDAATLEAAMLIEAEAERVVRAASGTAQAKPPRKEQTA